MKLLISSDLHLGKRIHEYSMIEDQRHILKEIVRIASEKKPDAVILAGDIYDRAVPSEEAVTLFGGFLTDLRDLGCEIFVIAGNHDSGARLDYCDVLLGRNGIHIAGRFEGRAEKITCQDEYGPLNVWLLPYFKVSEVRAFSGDDISDYGAAMGWILRESGVDPKERNILVAHQFFAGRTGELILSDSEDQRPEVGGIASIPVNTLDCFDMAVLGHLHTPQQIQRPTVFYPGSPLKYSKSEARSEKGVVIADVRGKDEIELHTILLTPLHDMRRIKGTVRELVSAAPMDGADKEDYIFVDLTEIPTTSLDDLYRVYPNIMNISIENKGDGPRHTPVSMERVSIGSISELFTDFYKEMMGQDLTPYQRELLDDCVDACRRDSE